VRFGHLNGLRYHGLALKMGVDYPSPSIVLVDNAKNFPDNNANFRVSDKCKDFSQLVSFKLNKSQQVTISDL
jgi:hypothetical protein